MAINKETGHIPLKFKQSMSPFNAEEVGGVPLEKAHQLVKSGIAEYHDPDDAPPVQAPIPLSPRVTHQDEKLSHKDVAEEKKPAPKAEKTEEKDEASEGDAETETKGKKSLDAPPGHKAILHPHEKKGR